MRAGAWAAVLQYALQVGMLMIIIIIGAQCSLGLSSHASSSSPMPPHQVSPRTLLLQRTPACQGQVQRAALATTIVAASSCTLPLWYLAPPQYALAAHSVSQLHAVDGGTTYGLPHDCLLLPVREAGATALSCKGVIAAASWWLRLCGVEGFELEPRALSPRGLFELCLRKAEVAADCWRRRNGLPAAAAEVAAAAATRAGASGSGGQGAGGSSSSSKAARSGRQQRQGKAALEVDTVGLCLLGGAGSTASGSSGSPAADPPRATLDPSQCPDLVIQAMACSRALAKSSCGVGARNAAWLGDGGPLARRWWRAAVAAVHCALDEMDAVGPRPAAGSLDKVLDLSLATPGRNPGGTHHAPLKPMPLVCCQWLLRCVSAQSIRHMQCYDTK